MLTPEDTGYSMPLVQFINTCLTKDKHLRPNYDMLCTFPFYRTYAEGGSAIEEAKEMIGVEVRELNVGIVN